MNGSLVYQDYINLIKNKQIINKNIEKKVFDIEIKNFKSTKDSDLLKLVNIIENVN